MQTLDLIITITVLYKILKGHYVSVGSLEYTDRSIRTVYLIQYKVIRVNINVV
jgi:hypothetical protein